MVDSGEAKEQEAQEQDASGRTRPRQTFGSVPWEPGKSRVEPETLAYLTEVSEHAAGLEDPEERDLLLNNVLEELEGKELRVAADAVCSRLLEALLAPASPRHLIAFMGAFTTEDDLYKLAGRYAGAARMRWGAGRGSRQRRPPLRRAPPPGPKAPHSPPPPPPPPPHNWPPPRPKPRPLPPETPSAFGSHVAEGFLQRLGAAADEGLSEEDTQELEALLASLAGAIGDQMYDYLMDRHATHVARALLRVAAGRDVVPASKQGKQKQRDRGAGGAGPGGARQRGDKVRERAGLQRGAGAGPRVLRRAFGSRGRRLPMFTPA
jgi:hypothetical protein